MGLMLVIAVAFLIALPQGATAGVNRLFHLGLDVQAPVFQAITGAFKLTIVVGYLLLIRRIPDIRRVFQYHGAEHKTISTYEARRAAHRGERAREDDAPSALRDHVPGDGRARVDPRLHRASARSSHGSTPGARSLDNVVFFLEKLPFLPLIAGFTFELQRIFARYCTTGPLRALLWPGFLVQKITTTEPDDAQLEIALASLRATLFREEGKPSEAADAAADVAFPSYAALAAAPSLRAA